MANNRRAHFKISGAMDGFVHDPRFVAEPAPASVLGQLMPSSAASVRGGRQRMCELTSTHFLLCVAIAVSLFQSAASGQTPSRDLSIDTAAHDPRSGVSVPRDGSRLTLTL